MCSWISGGQTMRNTYGRQAIPMVWDYAEANPLSQSTGSFSSCLDQVCRVVSELPSVSRGASYQNDAQNPSLISNCFISPNSNISRLLNNSNI